MNESRQSEDINHQKTQGDLQPPDSDREERLAQALADYVDLPASENHVDIECFCRQYPGLEADLRQEIGTLHELDVLTEVAAEREPAGSTVIERL